MTTNINRDKLRELCERATPGPWTVGYDHGNYKKSCVYAGGNLIAQFFDRSNADAEANALVGSSALELLEELRDTQVICDTQAAKIVELEALVKDLQVERGELAEHVARSQVTRLHLESERDQLRKQVEERFVAGMLEAARIAWKRFDTGSAHKYASNECSAAILSAASALEQKEQG